MNIQIEFKKIRRTGYFPAFIAGALLACAFPVINMAARSTTFTSLKGSPVTILFDADWQMMSMLNILLIVCGACMMYHTEYADHGMQKMEMLPVRPEGLFLGKFLITAMISALVVLLEVLTIIGCALRWFPHYRPDPAELICNLGFELMVLLPTIMLMLVIASACQNMWISLGIGVILVFILSILPHTNLLFSLCPFSSPYQLFEAVHTEGRMTLFAVICAAETIIFGMIECIYLKIRRYYS